MTSKEQQEGLWRNCADSIRHALEHFSAGAEEDDEFHHRKWALLSVAHAAEVYGNLLLCVFNPKHPERKDGHYPSLVGVRKMLKDHPRLTPSERLVFDEVFAGVAEQRHTLMHMPAPEVPVVRDAAKALLALLHIVRRRTGLPSKEFFKQYRDPPIEQVIFEDIDWRDYDDWSRVAESLVLSEYEVEDLKHCNYCGSFAVPPDARCQACFHERLASSLRKPAINAAGTFYPRSRRWKYPWRPLRSNVSSSGVRATCCTYQCRFTRWPVLTSEKRRWFMKLSVVGMCSLLFGSGAVIGCAFTSQVVAQGPVAEVQCGATAASQLRTTLYFGLARPKGSVSELEWQVFLRDEVTTRFPEGLTVWEANGQWRRPDGEIDHERSKVLLLVHPDTATARTAVQAVIGRYRQKFEQESVLWESARVCIAS